MNARGSGILFHVTCLPSRFGVGDLGPEAFAFADFLAQSGQRYWQILPLNPTDSAYGNSPYQCCSTFALNPLLISPEGLLEDGWLERHELEHAPRFPQAKVAYKEVTAFKAGLLRKAYQRLKAGKEAGAFEAFCREHAGWLRDYALFKVLKWQFKGRPWSEWPDPVRNREPAALKGVQSRHAESMQHVCFVQYLVHKQWERLKTWCGRHGIHVLGDLPIYVMYDSVDVWAFREIFNLDAEGRPLTVAGVPPDYFSQTGQLWGTPVYRWDVLQRRGYDWWLRRIGHHLALFDLLRIDHFRGLVAYWEVPAGEKRAVHGWWVEAPARDFLDRVTRTYSAERFVAENLGFITPEVEAVRQDFGFAGMAVLLFAFGDDLPYNPYAPHNLERQCVVYTGTHDNNTARGWFENEATPEMRTRLQRYLDRDVSAETIGRDLVRLAMMSVAERAVFPLQDVLSLGEEARMNRPATAQGNWEWRLRPGVLDSALAGQMREMSEIYGRI